MVTYDPRGMEWDQWCPLMAELFAGQQLGTVDEVDWRLWVDGLSGIGYFANSNVPDSRGFETWQDWAQALVGIMDIKATT
jgi:hypothetical protein